MMNRYRARRALAWTESALVTRAGRGLGLAAAAALAQAGAHVTLAARTREEIEAIARPVHCELQVSYLVEQQVVACFESDQAAGPNSPAIKSTWSATFSFASHLTRPFRIMCTVSIPCNIRHAV
jgi:hypothetical protein